MHAQFTDIGSQNFINLFVSTEVENIHSYIHSSLSTAPCSLFLYLFYLSYRYVGFLYQWISLAMMFNRCLFGGAGQFHMARNLVRISLQSFYPDLIRIP